jgi:hypothetical protein
MNSLQEFLITIGAQSKDFQTGMIAGAIIVMIALFLVLILSAIGKKTKKVKTVKTKDEPDENIEKIKNLKLELDNISNESKLKIEESFTEGALYSLVLLQREGRFVDFIKENIDAFEDAQIGAAVRQIHTGCKKVLDENFNVKPLFDKTEGETISLGDSFDPAEIKMSGNVPEKAPYNGELRHKGWKSEKVKLPKRTGKVNVKVVCPAEIEF